MYSYQKIAVIIFLANCLLIQWSPLLDKKFLKDKKLSFLSASATSCVDRWDNQRYWSTVSWLMNVAGLSVGLPHAGYQCTSQPPDFLTPVLSWLLYIWPGHYLPLRMLSPLSFFRLKARESARMSSALSSRKPTLKSWSHQDTHLRSPEVKGFEVGHRGSMLSFYLFYQH